MQETIERYQRHTKDVHTNNYKTTEHNMQHLKHEAANMAKKIELLEISKRKLLGEGLGSCSIEELQQIEQQLERSVSSIRARKNQVFKEQIEQLKEKEKALAAENAMLCEKVNISTMTQFCQASKGNRVSNYGLRKPKGTASDTTVLDIVLCNATLGISRNSHGCVARKMVCIVEEQKGMIYRHMDNYNDRLFGEACGVQPYQAPNQENETLPSAERSQNSDVSTDLFIGLPEGRAKRLLLGN
ncbi:MADS-box protein SOC1 [Vitis vinifera]|uniref:MADS-box protein SOC1 n=1 Tax=Vitis vinifera TaxID=29760 RepID=A0A438E0G1_VITVI|nr:MADS-box protein SOC1 [Vitis vinifera]